MPDPVPAPAIALEHIGEGVTYADGAENELLSLVGAAVDRRAVSDELASLVHDWPTRYHLSRLRANLLAPLQLRPGLRVLDVGAGTGVIARRVAERGASVVALEGNPDRAAAAAARCAGAGDVRVLVGSVADLDEDGSFDLTLCVGVLEYAGAPHGGGGGPEAFLQRLAGSIRPGGAVAIAIENQLGLKYLLGHDEDHLARPMIGVEGYPGAGSVRTWSRSELGRLLTSVGLTAHRWLAPFPDYKLPTTILDETAYDDPGLVDHLLRWPTADHLDSRVFPVDHRAAHRELVAAGLGLEVPNSFLVVAGRSPDDVDAVVAPDAVAWLAGGDRRRGWRRVRRLDRGPDGLRLTVVEPAEGVADSWLGHDEPSSVAWTGGRTLERALLDAWADDDVDATGELLDRWDEHLRRRERPADTDDGRPFAPAGSALPDDHLDVGLANFVDDGDDLVYVDAEWRVDGGVHPALARYRALWYLARDAVEQAVHRPPALAGLTVDELTASLAGSIALDPDELHAHFLDDEARLQQEVSGGDAGGHRAALVDQGGSAGPDRVARVVGRTGAELRALAAERDQLAAHVHAAEAELAAWRARWAKVERLPPVRLVRWMRRPRS